MTFWDRMESTAIALKPDLHAALKNSDHDQVLVLLPNGESVMSVGHNVAENTKSGSFLGAKAVDGVAPYWSTV